MAKNYTITFKSLRAGTTYVVNIGGGTGTPVPLMGGSQPFTTQEDDDEDMFTPIRTQSGYLRIIDNGKDANGNVFDWKDLIPVTDTSRPVTLTHQSGGSTIVDWQGFMQAQDFGSVLYGNPQEREFPIQCVLTVTQGTDINYQQTAIQNFAYLLKHIVDAIPSAQRPTDFYIQGGADAQSWLLKKIDWQNYVSEDADGNLTARFNCYNCLEDMCAFWGWTARTKGTAMYLTCADDSAETNWLHLTYANLTTMASGTTAGTTSDTFTTTNLDTTNSGDIFASTGNDEYVQRGHNKAVVEADTNRGDDDVVDVFDDKTVEAMENLGWHSGVTHDIAYTDDLLTVQRNFWNISCRSGYGSLNIGRTGTGDQAKYINVIRIKKTGGNSVTPFVQMETVYEHNFSDGFLMFFGTTYRYANLYENPFQNFSIGQNFMFCRIGIGRTRETAMWWNNTAWQSSQIHCRVGIGNQQNFIDKKDEFPFWYPKNSAWWAENILPITACTGKLFIDFLGTDDPGLPAIDGEKSFELCDLKITFQRNAGVKKEQYPSEQWKITDKNRPTSFSYTSNNQNSVRNEWNADCIYATENACKFCYGEIFDPSGALITSVPYAGGQERPEQHLADRVTTYWQTSKRRIATELRANVVPDITPRHKVVLDGTTAYPISISRQWRDDVLQLTVLEL